MKRITQLASDHFTDFQGSHTARNDDAVPDDITDMILDWNDMNSNMPQEVSSLRIFFQVVVFVF